MRCGCLKVLAPEVCTQQCLSSENGVVPISDDWDESSCLNLHIRKECEQAQQVGSTV